jgi:hypothetical protein
VDVKVSTFRESTGDVCFWCKGALGSGGILVGHEKQTIRSCIECAVDAGAKLQQAATSLRDAIEIEAFGQARP